MNKKFINVKQVGFILVWKQLLGSSEKMQIKHKYIVSSFY